MFHSQTFTVSNADITSEYGVDLTPSSLENFAPSGAHALLHHQLLLSGLDSNGGTITARWKVVRNSTVYYGPSESVTYQPGDTTLVVDLKEILFLSEDSLTLLLLSDNASDTSVDISVVQVNAQQVNVGAISESTEAADTVESRIGNLDVAVSSRANGAYYTYARAQRLDNLDATVSSRSTLELADLDSVRSEVLSAIYDIGVAAASVGAVATSRTISAGTEGDNTSLDDTYGLDESYHIITASDGEIDVYYEFTLDDDYVPVGLHIKGRLHEGNTPSGQDSVNIQVYDWNSSAWETVVPLQGGFVGVANSDNEDDEVRVVPLFARHKDSSTNAVRVRFVGTGLKTGTALYVDQIYLTYTAVLSYTGIAGAILANTDYKLQTDSDGYALADAVKIGGSKTAADDVKAKIGNLDAAVSTRATPAQVNSECDTALSDAGVTTARMAKLDNALLDTTWTDARAAKLDNLDAAITTRLAAADYTAPDNAGIAAIQAQTDQLEFAGGDVKATLDGEKVTVSSNEDKTGYSLTSDYDAAKTAAKPGDQMALTTVAVASLVDTFLDEPASEHRTADTVGEKIYDAGEAGAKTINITTDTVVVRSE